VDYLKHYILLIRKAEGRDNIECDVEKHHIFPVSIYGKNNRVVSLTYREHYIAHSLLWKACIQRYGKDDERTKKMCYAFWRMHCLDGRREYQNSVLYEANRKEYVKRKSNDRVGWYDRLTDEQREKMRVINSKVGKVVGKKVGSDNVKLKRGYCGRDEKQMSIDGKMGAEKTNKQRWKCLKTGFITNSGSLSRFQMKRGIDVSLRERVS